MFKLRCSIIGWSMFKIKSAPMIDLNTLIDLNKPFLISVGFIATHNLTHWEDVSTKLVVN